MTRPSTVALVASVDVHRECEAWASSADEQDSCSSSRPLAPCQQYKPLCAMNLITKINFMNRVFFKEYTELKTSSARGQESTPRTLTELYIEHPYWRFSIKKTYKGHSQDPPTLVVKWMETLSRDVTWLRSDAFKKISCGAGSFKTKRFEIFSIDPLCHHPPPLPVGAGARGDGVAKQIDLGPRWDPGPPPERSVACRHRAALRVVPEQQSIPSPPARPSSRC